MTPQLQFLQDIEIQADHCDVGLSDYNFAKVRKLKKVSKLRWVQGTNLKLAPGSGSGTITIGKETFTVTYAWGGRNKPKGGNADRTSYTVRLSGDKIAERLQAIKNQIILEEEGTLSYFIPFRKYQQERGIKCPGDFLEELKNISEMLSVPKAKAIITNFNKNWEANQPVELHKQMRDIETDMI